MMWCSGTEDKARAINSVFTEADWLSVQRVYNRQRYHWESKKEHAQRQPSIESYLLACVPARMVV